MRSTLYGLAITAAVCFWAATAQAQIVWMNYTTSWQMTQVTSGTYAAVAVRDQFGLRRDLYGATLSSGINFLDGTASPGSWSVSPLISSPNYRDLSAQTDGNGFFWGVNTSGGVDWLNWSGGWQVSPMVSGSYVSVANQTNTNSAAYAARADGGIDLIAYNGSAWVANALGGTVTGKYVDIAPERGANGFLWGVRDTGAIDRISWAGGWTATQIIAGNYTSVAPRTTDDNLYATLASGGIAYVNDPGTGWAATPLITGTTVYGNITRDLRNADFAYTVVVPEPTGLALLASALIGPLVYAWRKRA